MNQSAMMGKGMRTLLIGTMLTLGGCSWFGGGEGGGQSRRQVNSTSFTTVAPANPNPPEGSFRPQVQTDLLAPRPNVQVMVGEELPNQPSVDKLSPEVISAVPSPTDLNSTTQPAGAATRALGAGSYLTIGGVVARVNGQAITANRVLKFIAPALAAKARELDEPKYRKAAKDLIAGQIDQFIKAQVFYAAASRNLDENEKILADNLTYKWRQDQVTAAGGSEQTAMQNALAATGRTLEELTEDQHETETIRVYYQKRLIPRIQVTTQDMREYYRRNLNTLFTEQAAVSFRLIKIDPKNLGSADLAKKRVEEIRQRLERGESFADLASSMNHDKFLEGKGGLVGPIDKGSYGLEQVEATAWKTPVGKVSDTIEERGSLYLLKVESLQDKRVRPFTDEKVQRQISDQLRGEQLSQLRSEHERKLLEDAIVTRDPKAESIALDIAMQAYHIWRAEPTGATQQATPATAAPVTPPAPAAPVAPSTPAAPEPAPANK